jgi:hypothetical protein
MDIIIEKDPFVRTNHFLFISCLLVNSAPCVYFGYLYS